MRLIIMLMMSFSASAHNTATVDRVIDGDTVELSVNIWPGLTQQISLRLDGVNTPEKRGSDQCEKAAAKEASAFTDGLLAGQRVTVTGVRLGKYAGRVLGRISVDGVDLGDALIAAGHARPYDGGKREAWCKQ